MAYGDGMPELPEVETVRRGLMPAMEGATFDRVTLHRPDLRYPFPKNFSDRLTGTQVENLERRGKYLLAHLSSGETLIMHLGMSGRFDVLATARGVQARERHAQPHAQRHAHVVFDMRTGRQRARVVYADPRRFGFMDLVATEACDACRHFAAMGPEPMGEEFSATALQRALRGRASPLKTALLDQSVVAGLGNIYVCEALWRSGLSPRRKAGTVGEQRAARLFHAIRDVLGEAITSGGSSLRDYRSTGGEMGMFQHRFDVYDRAGEPCRQCGDLIQQIRQSGRSTFFCAKCQR